MLDDLRRLRDLGPGRLGHDLFHRHAIDSLERLRNRRLSQLSVLDESRSLAWEECCLLLQPGHDEQAIGIDCQSRPWSVLHTWVDDFNQTSRLLGRLDHYRLLWCKLILVSLKLDDFRLFGEPLGLLNLDHFFSSSSRARRRG